MKYDIQVSGQVSLTQRESEFIQKSLSNWNQKDLLEDKSLRVFLQEETEQHYLIHIGPADPESGGGAENYKLIKSSGAFELESSEDLAPLPDVLEE